MEEELKTDKHNEHSLTNLVAVPPEFQEQMRITDSDVDDLKLPDSLDKKVFSY